MSRSLKIVSGSRSVVETAVPLEVELTVPSFCPDFLFSVLVFDFFSSSVVVLPSAVSFTVASFFSRSVVAVSVACFPQPTNTRSRTVRRSVKYFKSVNRLIYVTSVRKSMRGPHCPANSPANRLVLLCCAEYIPENGSTYGNNVESARNLQVTKEPSPCHVRWKIR